jgi:predicted enzyme related to lactoylglutathione lyase
VVLAFSAGMDMMGPNIFQFTRHQQLVGGLMSFWLHLFGTDLPIMIVMRVHGLRVYVERDPAVGVP